MAEGWDQKENYHALADRLREQALSPTGQEVDIANVATILWYLNRETKAPR